MRFTNLTQAFTVSGLAGIAMIKFRLSIIILGGGLWQASVLKVRWDEIMTSGLQFHGITMKTLGEIEAAVGDSMSRFEREYMGRGPKDIHTYLIEDLLVVRLTGVLTAAEQHLVGTLSADKGRDLLKQVRIQLIETARPIMDAMIHEITGVKVLSLHHDISTITGEEIVIFTLTESPLFREAKKK